MVNAKQVADALNGFAPFELQYPWDNCGINLDMKNETDRILVALDPTDKTVAEAARRKCGILVTHHPLLFDGMKKLSVGDPVVSAVKAGISVVCVHTCWDKADGGINDVLAERLGLIDIEHPDDIVRMGTLPKPLTPQAFAQLIKTTLGCNSLSYVDGGKQISRVAIVGGRATMTDRVIRFGADAYLTGELKHEEALAARDAGLTAVAAGHFESESAATCRLAERLAAVLDVEILTSEERTPYTVL